MTEYITLDKYAEHMKIKQGDTIFVSHDARKMMWDAVTNHQKADMNQLIDGLVAAVGEEGTTMRCSEGDIRAMQENHNYICLCGRLIDKFGDNGIVTVIVGEILKDELHIRLWLMSCRVLKRGMEDYMMNKLAQIALTRGISTIYGYYYPTAKNSIVKDFYLDHGYKLISEAENGNLTYLLSTDSFENIRVQITDN